MLCTKCQVRRGTELAQVGFYLAALFDACEINRDIYLDKYGIKRSRKKCLPIFVIEVNIFTSM